VPVRSDMNGFPQSGMPVLSDVLGGICLNTLYPSPLRPAGFVIDVIGACRLLGALTINGPLSGATSIVATTLTASQTISVGTNLLVGPATLIGSTLARALKGYFKDIECSNIPTVNGDSLLAIIQSTIAASGAYAASAKGVTNGDTHDHAGGDGGQIAYDGLSGLPDLVGYALPVIATSSGIAGVPADSKTYYYGGVPQSMDENPTYHRIYIPKAGTIKAAYICWVCAGGGGTNEGISTYIRLNNTTDTLVSTLYNTYSNKIFSNVGLNISVIQGDYIEIKTVTPAWVTNPSDVRIGGTVYIE
jgi:hypothetical protein